MDFAQSTTIVVTSSESATISPVFWVVYILILVIALVANWKIFEKAGEAGWKVLVPFYNTFTLFRISGRNGWWFLAMLVPLVNIFIYIRLALDLAKHFGKSTMFAIFGLLIFSFIGYLMLGYGDAKYVGTKHE
jgi:hypothetical protein